MLASKLPETNIKEERTWRKQEVRNAKALVKSRRLAKKHYPDGIIPFDEEEYEAAYNMPDDTREQAKARRKAMRVANKKRNIYATVATPYLTALRTIKLAEGYNNLDEITKDYDDVVNLRNIRLEEERVKAEKLAEERRLDKESKERKREMDKLNKQRSRSKK